MCEGGGLSTLVYEGLAEDQQQAGILALQAGVDVGISYEAAYQRPLKEGVEKGLVSQDLIDRAVRRILKQKFRLGLFERPFVDLERESSTPRNIRKSRIRLPEKALSCSRMKANCFP